MIRLIVGLKGSGKTTRLIEMVNEAVAADKGDVICVEKTTKLNNDLDRRVRLIDMDDYEVGNFDGLYGPVCMPQITTQLISLWTRP